MKKRVISGIVFSLIWIAILLINNDWFDTSVVAILSLISTYEYFKAFKNVGHNPISWIGYLGCLAIFLMGGIIPEEYKVLLIKIVVPLGLISAFTYMILGKVKRTIIDVAITIFSLLYIPFMFSFIKLILDMEYGRFFILYVLCGAFISDTFAFLVGSKIGKTKLAPDISPNKTVEGSIGGLLGNAVGGGIFAGVMNVYFEQSIDLIGIVILGIFCSVIAQLGDLSFSLIKREFGINDYGNLFLAHGGVLDRFDSVLFVAPVLALIMPWLL